MAEANAISRQSRPEIRDVSERISEKLPISEKQPIREKYEKEIKEFNDRLNDKLRMLQQKEPLNKAIRKESFTSIKQDLDVQEIRVKISHLEEMNKNLQSKIADINETNNTTVPDTRIMELESKLRQLEGDKEDLENRLCVVNREQTEQIDKLADSIRRISMQGSELEGQVRNLKTKVPQLEDMNRRQDSMLETIKYKYNDTTYEKIKDLEKTVQALDESNRKMEDKLANMHGRQREMAEEAEDRIRQSYEQKMELENKVSKLKGKLKDLERINQDLQGRLEEMRAKALEAAESENERLLRLKEDIDGLQHQIKLLNEEKTALETDNNMWKKEYKKMKVKLIAYEKDLN